MSKLCECGCGKPTNIITKTSRRENRVKGEYSRFAASGCSKRGRTLSDKARRNISNGLLRENPGYRSLHGWINRHHPKTGICEECGKPSLDYHSVGHTYTRNREDWQELCRSCHKTANNALRGESLV